MMLSRVSLPLIRLLRHPMHVSHTLMPCLLLLPVHLLPPQLRVALHAHLLLLASCLCRGPPVAACFNSWSDAGRVKGPTGTKRV